MSVSSGGLQVVRSALRAVSEALPSTLSRSDPVAVAVSGGVDSSVTLFLLKELGLNVHGVFMKCWDESDERGTRVCPSTRDLIDARAVCAHLHSPFTSVDFVKEYWNEVFTAFLDDMAKGWTPNPDVLCNSRIKFHHLVDFCRKHVGASFLATGHYARLSSSRAEEVRLSRARCGEKDQSYFLCAVPQAALACSLFPVGHLETKAVVRQIARIAGLETHQKKDSVGICFVGKRDFPDFVSRYLQSPQRGNFIDIDTGRSLGRHPGLHGFTIGQGARLPSQAVPYFVCGKDGASGTVFVARGKDHPALFSKTAAVPTVVWNSERRPENLASMCQVRYRQRPERCTLSPAAGGGINIEFHDPQRAITPGQWLGIYDADGLCYGGGQIAALEPITK